MPETIQLADISVAVVRKRIKHVHLSVHPPTGRVTISAPVHTSLDTIQAFAATKIGWIRRQQAKLREQEREPPREAIDRESYYVWGQRCLLKVVEVDTVPSVCLEHDRLVLRVRPGTEKAGRLEVLDAWYRDEVRATATLIIPSWETKLGVKVVKLFVRRMRTRWGSCNHRTGNIRLNTDLAKKPRECLEYVVVHEMIHLLEPSHDERFKALMDRYLPKWRFLREELNRLPVRHEEWEY